MSSIKIDRAFLKTFTGEAEKALKDIADRYGITVTYKGGSYDRDGANAKLKFEIAAPDPKTGESLSAEAQEFKALGHVYGFQPEDLGSEFTVRGTRYRITGLKTRRPKYPISAIRVSDGKGFKFPEGAVKNALKIPQHIEGLTPAIRDSFARLVGDLSPENLTCDGELTEAETNRKYRLLKAEWAALERRAGQKVSEDQAWEFGRV